MKVLSYRISKYPKKLHKFDVDREVAKAFALWTQHIDLTFSPKFSGPVDIDIRFESSEHGDGTSFDGQGTVLAHAKYPVHGGDVHFDDSELWTINNPVGINLFQVAGKLQLCFGFGSLKFSFSTPDWSCFGLGSFKSR